MKRAEGFTADDGTWYATAAECKQYEEGGRLLDLLSGLSQSQIRCALFRTDVELANAIELAGTIIARKRRKSGELRRNMKKSGGTETLYSERPND